MYMHTSFRGTKPYKIEKKGVFFVMFTNSGKDSDGKIKGKNKKKKQKQIIRVYFHTWKIHA